MLNLKFHHTQFFHSPDEILYMICKSLERGKINSVFWRRWEPLLSLLFFYLLLLLLLSLLLLLLLLF